MKTGVYQIRNLVNGKRYIGSASISLARRWIEHQSLLVNGQHNNKLQNAWQKYGASAFIFEILEECPPRQCIKREQHYLDTLLFASRQDKCFNQLGYNIRRVAENNLGITFSDETKLKMSRARTGKRHSQSTRDKIGLAHRGQKRSVAARKNMSSNHSDCRGLKNPNVKITKKNVVLIRELYRCGIKLTVIASQFKISRQHTSRICHGHSWSHINVS